MILSDILQAFEKEIPLSYQEPWDVCGLQVGSRSQKIRGVLFSMDATLGALEEAAAKKADLIVTHHPLTLSKFAALDLDSPYGAIIRSAIEKGIAIYSAHTNHDASTHSLSRYYAGKLGLKNIGPIRPMGPMFSKLVVFVPEDHTQAVLKALFDAGAGHIGAYSSCSFRTPGTGTFLGDATTDPFLGKPGELEEARENRVEVIVRRGDLPRVIAAMLQAHPYEEVAYDVINLENPPAGIGAGAIGQLPEKAKARDLIPRLKKLFQAPQLRFVGNPNRAIGTIAICNGSGMSLLKDVARRKADLFITGDVKYHAAIDAELAGVCLADIGHFHSEIRAVTLLKDLFSNLFGERLKLHEYKKLEDPFKYY